jgi:hypothetical protein
MPHDPTIQNRIRQIALEQSVSLSDARRILIEQIDLAKRKVVRKPGLAERNTKKVLAENPQRRLVSANPISNTPTTPASNTVLPERVKTDNRVSGAPTRRNPETKKSASSVKSPDPLESPKLPAPNTVSAVIHGIIRDSITFQAAENKLMGLKSLEHLSRSAIRTRMYAVVDRYNLPIK